MTSRIRQVPHIEGNFATLVYVELSHHDTENLMQYTNQCKETLFKRFSGSVEDIVPHLSLSKHVFLKPHLIDGFLTKFRSVFPGAYSRTTAFLLPEVRLYSNESGDTCFGAVPVDLSISPSVLSLIKTIDSIFSAFDLSAFYVPSSPHVSLACVSLSENLSGELIYPLTCSDEQLDELKVDIDCISIRIGKDVHRIPLG